jgi:WD40 repeat protein
LQGEAAAEQAGTMNARQARDLFVAAVKLPPERWESYLDAACAGDAELRRRVSELLRSHREAGSFLESPAPEARATIEEASNEQPGEVLAGRYKLVEEIGAGGMGTVWLAQQHEPVKRLVAIKLIKTGMDSKRVLARFEQERQALALMDHPNIARVLDAGVSDGGRPFFVMERVLGVPITQYCDEHRLTPRQRLELFVAVCAAIQHAHQKGVIHRDIKPSNVLVASYDDAPVVKVIDFGVAKATGQPLTEETLQTGFGTVVGTLEYMSPEQASFNNLDIDTRSDVYSLGVLLYELLAGSPPFSRRELEKAGLLEMLRLIREEEPSKPSTRLSTAEGLPTLAANRGTEPKRLTALVRGELDWIVMKALEKDRSRRYESANSLALDVRRYLHDEPVQACPPSAWYRFRKFARRNKVALLAAVVIGSVLVLATAVSTWQVFRATNAERAMRRQAAELALDKGQLLGEKGEAGLSLLWLARSLKLAPPDAVQLQAAIRTNLGAWQRQANSLRLILPHDGGVFAAAFDDDGKIVTASWRPGTATVTVRRWDPATGWPGESQTFPGDLAWADVADPPLAFSPKGDYLLIGFTDGTAQLRDLATGRSVWKKTPEESGHVAISAVFSPDGKMVLVGYAVCLSGRRRHTGKAQLFEVATGNPLGPAMVHERPVQAAAFHPAGKGLVTESGLWGEVKEPAEARFWDLQGCEIDEPLGHSCIALDVAFSPDGTKLLTGHWDFKARLWNLAAPQEPVVLQLDGPVACVDFSPDGQTLLTGAFNGSVRLWDLSGRPLGPPLRHGHMIHAATFSRDGKTLLIGSRRDAARVWDLAAGGRGAPAETPEANFFPLAISPDCQTILARGAEHTVQLRHATTYKPVGAPLPHPRPVLIGGTSVLSSQRQACSSDHRRVLTVDEDDVARLWDAQTGKLLTPLKTAREQAFLGAAFSPDGKLIVTANFLSMAHVWDAATGELKWKLKHQLDGPVFNVTFSPNGKLLLTGGADKAVRFWDPDTGEPLGQPLLHDSAVLALAFCPKGETVLTGDVDHNVQLWDVKNRRRLLHLSGHQGGINDAAFSPDGRFVVTGSQDHTARLWHAASGKPIGPILPHAGPVIRVAFGHDGQTVLTATEDQIARSWLVPAAMTGTAEQIELWAQVATGMELEADGERVLDAADWQKRREQLTQMGPPGSELPR